MLEKECVYNLRNRNVQRMLWPVDHEQIRIDLNNEQLKMKKEMITKYNFDFDSEQPLGGRYQWEPVTVDPQEESPISSPILLNSNEDGASTSSTRTCRVLSKQKNKNNKSLKRTYSSRSTTTTTAITKTIPCKISRTGKTEKRKIKGASQTKTTSNSNLQAKRSKRLRSSSTSVSGKTYI